MKRLALLAALALGGCEDNRAREVEYAQASAASAEERASTAISRAEDLESDLDDLERRVSQLESNQVF